MKTVRQWEPFQANLLPPSPTDWLPKGDLATSFMMSGIIDIIEEVEISAISGALQSKDSRGERPYHPRMMSALLIYGYCVGVFSSRKKRKSNL